MKKLKLTTLLAVILTVGLVGCGKINTEDIKVAQNICKDNGGLSYVKTCWGGKHLVVVCNNGGEFERDAN